MRLVSPPATFDMHYNTSIIPLRAKGYIHTCMRHEHSWPRGFGEDKCLKT